MNSRFDYKVNADVIRNFEKMVCDCNPDQHYLFDKVYSFMTDCYKKDYFQNDYNLLAINFEQWEYKSERVENWFSGYLTTLSGLKYYYKKEIDNMVIEYD